VALDTIRITISFFPVWEMIGCLSNEFPDMGNIAMIDGAR
jgi:hypothetical protein